MRYSEKALIMRPVVEKAVQSLGDTDALKVPALFEHWAAGQTVVPDDRRYYPPTGRLYRVKDGMGYTTLADWTPDKTPAMWEPVDVTHSGTIDDPIPAVAGMTYVMGLYYLDGGTVYLCTRQDTDTGTVLAYLPHELVGNYFMEVAV